MTTMKTQNPLGYEKESKLLVNFAIPCIISMLVTSLYNIVDQIFIGQGIGMLGNAATNIAFPLSTTCTALSLLLGIGSATNFSLHLGAGEKEKSARYAGNGIFLMAVFGLCLFLATTLFLTPMLKFFGATTEVLPYARQYTRITAFGFPFLIANTGMSKLILADGSPRYSMISMLIGAIVNTILDPIFIFGLQWGMMGAAVATVIGQVVTAILAVWYLVHMRIIKPEAGDYALSPNIFGRMLTLGITSFLSQISLVAAMAAINNMLRKYGALDAVFSQEQYAQIPMAVVGIVMKFFQIVISIVVGMAAGCIPIVGYNMGAEKTMRVRELFTRLLISEALVGAVALILAEGFPHQLIAIFGASNESSYYTDFAVKAFRTYLCMMIFACVNKACFIFLQAVGKALTSTMLSMFREVVFGVGFALLLPVFFGLDGVLYSMPVSDILTFIISAVIIIKTYHELNVKGA